MKNYYRVMLGKGSSHFGECFDGNFIGTDFDVHVDLTENQTVRGAIIALDDDLRIRRALKVAPNIDFYRYEISFNLKKA